VELDDLETVFLPLTFWKIEQRMVFQELEGVLKALLLVEKRSSFPSVLLSRGMKAGGRIPRVHKSNWYYLIRVSKVGSSWDVIVYLPAP
jgi:hypothetical protein